MRKQSDPSLMQAIYKVSPVILDIHTALYYSTEWLILSSLYTYFIMRLVTYPAQGFVAFSTPKVCVYTGSDKISKTFSRILLPFCLITLPKDELDFMPKSPTMYMPNIYCWEHRQQLVRLSWVDGGAFWLLCSNHLGLFTACITGLPCNLMDALRYESCETGQSSFVIVMDSADDFTQLILQEDRNHKCNRIEERLNCGKMWLKTWPCMKTSGPLTNPCEVNLCTRCADCFHHEVSGTILVIYPAHGLVVFSRCKVCVYTSCRNHVESDKISKTFSRILLPFCIIKMSKNKLNFMPQSPTMYMTNFKHIPQSIKV